MKNGRNPPSVQAVPGSRNLDHALPLSIALLRINMVEDAFMRRCER